MALPYNKMEEGAGMSQKQKPNVTENQQSTKKKGKKWTKEPMCKVKLRDRKECEA